MSKESDDTVLIRRPSGQPRRLPWLLGGVAVAGICAAGAFLAWPGGAPVPPVAEQARQAPAVPPPAPAPAPAVVQAAATTADLPGLAAEPAILASRSGKLEVYRFQSQPTVFVLHYATLAEQADALNRAAALVEKSGFPRDRILPVDEMDRRIRQGGSTPDTFYYGHDYRAADLLRVFDAIDRSGTPMTVGEADLRRRITAWGWRPGTVGALITLVQENPAAGLDRTARSTILRHELSHGVYFTDPAYAQYSRIFWDSTLTAAERGRFRSFLASEGYDTTIDDLVVNETQAYLMHTSNKLFFNADAVGIPQARLDLLRGLFLSGMPPGWLRDCTSVP